MLGRYHKIKYGKFEYFIIQHIISYIVSYIMILGSKGILPLIYDSHARYYKSIIRFDAI